MRQIWRKFKTKAFSHCFCSFGTIYSKLKLEVVNSSPGRSSNGVGSSSIHQQQQTPSSSSSNFHLPELKPVINNNGNHHDGANESQNVSTEEGFFSLKKIFFERCQILSV
uniref:Candidate secreted effector n=1 Tax=Meloidogyne incognita TaxID=6306 RepID=A0A914N6N2_MELIC